MNAYVIKRSSKDIQAFDGSKLESSITAACLAVRAFEGEAVNVAQRVRADVSRWLSDKSEVTSADIRRVASECLQVYHPEAAYMYEHHRLIV